jgi:ABC-2 type transport system ATP-binding protein
VLLFDEPVNGLDPEGIHWIRGLLRGLAGQGRAVFVSSHLMSELEDTADHLIVVARGRLVADISVADLLARASGDRVMLRTARTAEAMAALTAGGATAALTGPETLTVTGLTGERITALLAGLPFAELTAYRVSLEQAYLELTRDGAEYTAARVA